MLLLHVEWSKRIIQNHAYNFFRRAKSWWLNMCYLKLCYTFTWLQNDRLSANGFLELSSHSVAIISSNFNMSNSLERSRFCWIVRLSFAQAYRKHHQLVLKLSLVLSVIILHSYPSSLLLLDAVSIHINYKYNLLPYVVNLSKYRMLYILGKEKENSLGFVKK